MMSNKNRDETWRLRSQCPECGHPRKSGVHATCGATACHAAYRARVDRACVAAYADKRRADPELTERQRASRRRQREADKQGLPPCVICKTEPRKARTKSRTCGGAYCKREYARSSQRRWLASLSEADLESQRQRQRRKAAALKEALKDPGRRAASNRRAADNRRKRILAQLWSDLQ